jgi:hypothetical protein
VRGLLDGRVSAAALTAVVAATTLVATGPAATALLTWHQQPSFSLVTGLVSIFV